MWAYVRGLRPRSPEEANTPLSVAEDRPRYSGCFGPEFPTRLRAGRTQLSGRGGQLPCVCFIQVFTFKLQRLHLAGS